MKTPRLLTATTARNVLVVVMAGLLLEVVKRKVWPDD